MPFFAVSATSTPPRLDSTSAAAGSSKIHETPPTCKILETQFNSIPPPPPPPPGSIPGDSAASDDSSEEEQGDDESGVTLTLKIGSPMNLARRLMSPKSAGGKAGPTEISRDAALKRLLTDESLSDVGLKGTDHVLVMANSCLLAARSDVFRSVLFGDSNPNGASTVSIGYKGCVLRALVEYVHTDKAEFVEPVVVATNDKKNGKKDGKDDEDNYDEFSAAAERALSVVSLVHAARYFGLPNLAKMAGDCAKAEMMAPNAPLASVYLSAAVELKNAELEEAAMDVVRSFVSSELLNHKRALELLSPDALELILKDEYGEEDDKGLFLFLCAWIGSGDDAEKERRKVIASGFVKHIPLEDMEPSDLAEIVSTSGLVTTDELMEAYKKQALTAGGAGGACVVS